MAGYWPKKPRLIFSCLDRTNLFDRGHIIWTLMNLTWLRGNIASSFPLGQPITALYLVYLTRSQSKPYNNVCSRSDYFSLTYRVVVVAVSNSLFFFFCSCHSLHTDERSQPSALYCNRACKRDIQAATMLHKPFFFFHFIPQDLPAPWLFTLFNLAPEAKTLVSMATHQVSWVT